MTSGFSLVSACFDASFRSFAESHRPEQRQNVDDLHLLNMEKVVSVSVLKDVNDSTLLTKGSSLTSTSGQDSTHYVNLEAVSGATRRRVVCDFHS